MISIQHEREWADFCRDVLNKPGMISDPRCADNGARCANREWIDGKVAEVFGTLGSAEVIHRLTTAQTAYGNINLLYDLAVHPQSRTRPTAVSGRMHGRCAGATPAHGLGQPVVRIGREAR